MTKRVFIGIDGVDLSDDAAVDRWAGLAWEHVTSALQGPTGAAAEQCSQSSDEPRGAQ